MTVSILRPDELTDRHLTEWRRLQRLDPLLESPFLCPEFVRIAADLRRNVVVAVAEENDAPKAFLPMQLRARIAGPVGCPVSDCQAIIAANDWTGDPRDLIRAAGVSAYDFDHQRIQQWSEPYHRMVFPSPVIDLSNGFDAYVAVMRKRGHASSSGRPHQTIKRTRRIERTAGPLHFTMYDTDKATLKTLIGWKDQQYQDSGHRKLGAYGWPVELLERIQTTQTDHFAGVLSTLRLGDRMIAAHIGLRSHNVLHWWFPTYDRAYAKFSPGLILLLELCKSAAVAGIRQIELGPGKETYKDLVADSQIMVASGFVGSPSIPLLFRYFCHGSEKLTDRLPIGPVRTWPWRLLRHINKMRWLRQA